MRGLIRIFSTLLVLVPLNIAAAQDAQPIIIPEKLQIIAKEFPVAQRLGISWEDGKTTDADIGTYLGFLAATAVVAEEIAKRNDRSVPTNDDYIAAISLQCIFPLNKPPFVEKTWPSQVAAFYNEGTRQILRQAVGPRAVAIPGYIAEKGIDDFIAAKGGFPEEQQDYYQQFFDADLLLGAQ
jgi:hypothetical protein